MSAAIELLMQLMGSTFRSVKRTDVIAACDLFVPELLVKTSDTNVLSLRPHLTHTKCALVRTGVSPVHYATFSNQVYW